MGIVDIFRRWLGIDKSAAAVAGVYTSPYKKDWVQYNGADYTTADISTVNACCRILGEALAGAEPRLFKPTGEAVINHPFLDSLQRGNDLMTWDELLKVSTYYIALTGAAYWYIDKSGSRYPNGYYPLAGGGYMKFKLDENGKYKEFEYNNNGKIVVYKADDILVFRNMSSDPRYPLQGRPIAAGADYAIQELIGFHNTRMSILDNGSRPDHVYSSQERIPPDEAKRFLEMVTDLLRGTNNQGKGIILPYGLKIEKFGSNLDELMYVEVMDDVKREICEVFRVPPTMLGTTGQYNKANIDAALGVFITQTVRPFAKIFENTFFKSLLPTVKLRNWKFELHLEVPKNDEMFAKTLNTNVMSGVMLPNEGRKLMNLPPIEGGDYQFVPVNVARVDSSTGEMVDNVYFDSATGTAQSKPTSNNAVSEAKEQLAKATADAMYLVRVANRSGAGYGEIKEQLLTKMGNSKFAIECSKYIDEASNNGYGIDWVNNKIKEYHNSIIKSTK